MNLLRTCKKGAAFASLALVLGISLVGSGTASAATAGSIYSYSFANSGGTITNNAASNPNATLALSGDWTASGYGVHFDGDTISEQSGAGYKPATGNTINAPSTSAVGTAVRFTYQPPATGSCFSDSRNLTQIGRFAANTAQVKIQTSNCGSNSTNVYLECRLAGNLTATSVLPVRSSQALTAGAEYIVKCFKTPDPRSGNAVTTLRVVKLDAVNGNTVSSNTFSVSKTGAITSSAWISVANKYALPSQSSNTDQFVGDIAKVSYCQSTTTAAVEACLNTEQPETASAPPSAKVQWVTNSGIETSTAGWGGIHGSGSLVRNTRTTAAAHTGTASLQTTALTGASNASLGFKDSPRWVTNTDNTKAYTGSVWVKPGFAGQEINLRLREWKGTTVVTDTKATITASSTAWQQITKSISPISDGNQLAMMVYGSHMNAGDTFLSDDLSLTSN